MQDPMANGRTKSSHLFVNTAMRRIKKKTMKRKKTKEEMSPKKCPKTTQTKQKNCFFFNRKKQKNQMKKLGLKKNLKKNLFQRS